jgi:hypothetical protein
LSWNPVGQGAGVNYEVRRCPALLTPTLSCTVVATVQSGSYPVVPGGGVYVVRALGPLGQFQGESNRVQLAAGGRQ